MAQPVDPDSPASDSSRSPKVSVEAFYQQAVAAFKAQDYARALALFQRLEALPSASPYRLKVLIGRVRVHQHLGQGEQARQLCRQLLDSPSPQAREWASQMLSRADKAAIAPTLDSPHPSAARADLSGFVPLEKASPQAGSNPTPPPAAASQPISPAHPGPTAEQSAALRPAEPASEGNVGAGSLFHYRQLNQQPDSDRDDASAAADFRKPASSPSPAPKPAARRPQAKARSHAQPLPRPLALGLGQALTAIALVWVVNYAFHAVLRTLDGLLRWVRWPVQLSLPGAYQSYTVWIVAGLVLLALASPWLIDQILTLWYQQRPLSVRQLQAHSPSALRLLRQMCRQQNWPMPELRLIDDSAPLCFSYGWLPRHTRIVVSQGLLDQTPDKYLTAFYAYELARMVNGSLPVLSAAGLPLVLLHTGYRRLAQAADASSQPLQGVIGGGAGLLYGLFWLLRQALLWLSRLCCRWGDRQAVALTQPGPVSEALLQNTEAIAVYLRRYGTLHPLHASLEVLMPVSSRQAIASGGLLRSSKGDRAAILSILIAIDGFNPYRQWLRVNASHQPLGERLLWLNQQAIIRDQPDLVPTEALQQVPLTSLNVSPYLLLTQKGPLVGLLTGGSLAMGLWFVGGVVNHFGWQRLNWLYQDSSILVGGLWLGLGIGLLLRVNALFPDPDSRSTSTPPRKTVGVLLQPPSALPVRAQPVTLQGKLRGLVGVGNYGCQELYLDDSTGLVKLAHPAPVGSFQGLFQPHAHPLSWIGREVTVTGWSRYGGGMLWVDINQVKLSQQAAFFTYGPIWATLVSLFSSSVGILIIFRGG
ncbi:MAG: hypothetical protein WBG38_13330 [Nodosilinea sp.]